MDANKCTAPDVKLGRDFIWNHIGPYTCCTNVARLTRAEGGSTVRVYSTSTLTASVSHLEWFTGPGFARASSHGLTVLVQELLVCGEVS